MCTVLIHQANVATKCAFAEQKLLLNVKNKLELSESIYIINTSSIGNDTKVKYMA